VRALRNLERQAAVAYPLGSIWGPHRRCSWLSDDETYKSWFDSHGPNLLHIHGTSGTSDASEYIFQDLNTKRAVSEPLIYFTFDKYDDHRNSLAGMLNSIHAQIYSHLPVYHAAAIVPEQQMIYYSMYQNYTSFRFYKSEAFFVKTIDRSIDTTDADIFTI